MPSHTPASAGEAPARAAALAWLAHPLSLAGIAVLLLNDHLLKAAFGAWWTGKLSDVAGLVFAPALVALVVALLAPRARAATLARGAIVGVGVVFAAVKATAIGAAAASAAWTAVTGPALGSPSIVRHDATDLLALPALALALWAFTQARSAREPGRRTRGARLAIVLPIAVFAVAATSGAEPPTATHVGAGASQVYVGVSSEYDEEPYWAASTDGRDFAWVDGPPSYVDPSRHCAGPDACYRVNGDTGAIEASSDAGTTWATVSGEASIRTERGEPTAWPAATGIAVAGSGDEYRVFASTPNAVFIARAPDGRWYAVDAYSEGVRDVLTAPPMFGSASAPPFMVAGFGVPIGLVALVVLALAFRERVGEAPPGVPFAWFFAVAGTLGALLVFLPSIDEIPKNWDVSENGPGVWIGSMIVWPILIASALSVLLSVPSLVVHAEGRLRAAYGWATLVGIAAAIGRGVPLPIGAPGWLRFVFVACGLAAVGVLAASLAAMRRRRTGSPLGDAPLDDPSADEPVS